VEAQQTQSRQRKKPHQPNSYDCTNIPPPKPLPRSACQRIPQKSYGVKLSKSGIHEEQVEELVVVKSHAVVYPWAMMVHFKRALIAVRTVVTPLRLPISAFVASSHILAVRRPPRFHTTAIANITRPPGVCSHHPHIGVKGDAHYEIINRLQYKPRSEPALGLS
jgi:hypothetical protein